MVGLAPRSIAASRRWSSAEALLPALAVVALVALLLVASPPTASGPPATSAVWSSPGTFNNSLLAARPGASVPGVTVANASDSFPYGLNLSAVSLQEYRGPGGLIAQADLAAASWRVTNSSTSAGLAISYFADVGEARPYNSTLLATVGVFLNLTAFAGAGTTETGATSVSVALAVLNWSWLRSTDSLAVAFSVAPNDSSIEHLASGPTDTLYCVPDDGAPALEYLTWDPTATGVVPGGATLVLSAVAQVSGSPEASTLTVDVEGANSTLRHLELGLRAGILVPPATAGVSERLAVLGVLGAAVIAVVLTVGARRLRERPPVIPERGR